MKNSLKRKLSLLLAIALVFTMALPTGLLASAAEGEEGGEETPVVTPLPALEEDVTDKVDTTTVQSTVAGFNGEGAENLFDNMPDTKYCGMSTPTEAAPLDFTWQMTEAVAVQTYAITSAADSSKYSGRDPKAWKFYGSTDGETWVELDSRSGQGFGTDGTTLLYTFENAEAYTYYKYSVTANRGETIVQFSCVQLSTKKFDSDADSEAIAAAAAFDQKLEALGELNEETYKGQETVEQVAALRAEYDALATAVKDKVTKLSILEAAEAYIVLVGAKDKCIALIDEIEATYNEYKDEMFVGTIDYHLNRKITYAMDLYNSLSAEDQAQVTKYSLLAEVRAYMDTEENDYFDVLVSGWDQAAKATKTPWIVSATEEEQTDSQNAATDELKYQYSRQGYKLGNYSNGSTVNLTAEWGEAMVSQFDGQPNDNVFNPWNQDGRQWAALCVPFAGTAFSLTGYFALNDTVTPISNAFYMNGKVYQQYMGLYKYYDYKEIAVLSETNTAPALTSVTSYPGYDGSADITNNTFRRAYAEYNQANKWNDVTLGIPAATAVQTESGIIYQAFTGPNGTSYIAASAETIALVDKNAPQAVAFVLDGDVMDIIAALDTENGDFVAGLEITGAPLTAMEDGIQLFENGVISDGAFAPKGADTEYLYVIIDINNLPTAITADNYDTAKAAIESARAAYDALTVNKDKVNADLLTAAESALEKYETDVNAAQAVTDMINALPQDITLDAEEDIKAARAAYDALTSEQKALVKGLNILVFCESEIDSLKVEAVETLMEAMPADEEITSDVLADKRVPVEEAKAAYDALTDEQKDLVNSALVSAMNYKLEIIAAGGIDKFIKKGDVDRDGKITVSDVVALRQLIVSGEKDDVGDMDDDGLLTVSDVVELRAAIVAG
jgi:hypothetical protein